jgi:hypothetical protein
VPAPSAVPPLDGARVPNVSLHVPGLVVLYRNHPRDEAMFGFADPFSVAPVPEMPVAASVVTEGDAGVVNESTAPKLVPSALLAMAQK